MEKLYLIRRNLETIVGPMTLEEFRRGFEHMEFGLQDEIAGHCSRWVSLDNTRLLRRYYPQVYRLLSDNVKSWSDASARPALSTGPEERRIVRHVKSYAPIWIPIVAVVCLLVGYHWGSLQRLLVPPEPHKEIKLSEATALYEAGRFQELEAFMKTNLPTLMAKHQGPILEAWLPYVRWYAYRSQGELSGVPAKLLRGNASEEVAPADCSLEAWKSRFREGVGEWKALFSEHRLPAAPWARLLAWDPHWIKRRPQAGWLKPESYYGACLYMGLLALHELTGEEAFIKASADEHRDKASLYLQALKTRLIWLSHVVNGTQKPVLQLNRKAFLTTDVWTCLEAASEMPELAVCLGPVGREGDEGWAEHHRYRLLMAMVRLSLDPEKKASVPREQGEALLPLAVNGLDAYTQFDFRAEGLFLKLSQREQSEYLKNIERTRAEFPSVILQLP